MTYPLPWLNVLAFSGCRLARCCSVESMMITIFQGRPLTRASVLAKLPRLCFGEAFQRRDGHLGMRLQEFGKEGGMQAGKPGGLFEGMFRCRDHQKEQIAGANPLQ